MAGTYPTSQAASRWASRWNPLSVELCLRPFLAWRGTVQWHAKITSHVYHEGVAQRAHNLSPVPFGAAKSDERSSYHCSDCASQTVVLAPKGQQVRWPALILRARRLAVGLAANPDRRSCTPAALAAIWRPRVCPSRYVLTSLTCRRLAALRLPCPGDLESGSRLRTSCRRRSSP